MKAQKIPRSFGTHDGTFHADEVTACALLLLFNCIDMDKIVRTRDLELLRTCEYVCDVGGVYDPYRKLFDHHQVEYKGDFSSAGMVLLYLRDEEYLTQKEYEFFYESLVHGVDNYDNGKDPQIPGVLTYSHIITNFTPVTYDADPEEIEAAFYDALAFAKGLLERMQEKYQYTLSCREIVEDTMKRSSECLMFDQCIPWQDSFFELNGESHPALFVIMPAEHHWKLRGIPPSPDKRMQVRLPLPQEWAGLLDEELKKISGIPGAIFCHKGRFISVWETREDAIKALDYVLKAAKMRK